MLFFGSISGSGGGGGNLWQLNGGAPNSISVNSTDVNGIDSPNFTANLIRLFSGVIFGVIDAVGSLWQNGTETLFSGVSKNGADYTGLIAYSNSATGELIFNEVNATLKHIYQYTGDGANLISERLQNAGGINEEVKNSAGGGVSVVTATNSTSKVIEIRQGLNPVLAYGADAAGFIVTDGTFQRFRITPSGNIQTDQTIAGNTHNAPTAEIPIYDMSGTLQGYIKLYN
jgi:hypothetical protein